MSYVDGFIIPLPKKNLKAYRRMAALGAKVWRKHGALKYFECVGDDLNSKSAPVKFPRMAKAKQGETVVLAFIVYKSRVHRDRVTAKVLNDPLMNDPQYTAKSMPFDIKRLAYGGFKTIVEA